MEHHDVREGHYRDKYGNWQPDRRARADRRGGKGDHADHERRKLFRRKADRELYERDHKEMIREALEEFAAEHDGHL